jgi:hypothetical protein
MNANTQDMKKKAQFPLGLNFYIECKTPKETLKTHTQFILNEKLQKYQKKERWKKKFK